VKLKISFYNYWIKSYIYFLIITGVILSVTFLDRSQFPDYGNYVINYNDYLAGTISPGMEKSFSYMAALANYFGDVSLLFIMYSALAIGIKFYAILKHSSIVLLSLLLYLSFYYTLHDIIQIRVAVSCSFFVLFFYAIVESKKSIAFVFFLASLFFHLQAIFITVYCIYLWLARSVAMMIFTIVGSYVLGKYFILKLVLYFVTLFSSYVPSKIIRDVLYFNENIEGINLLNQHVLVPVAAMLFYLYLLKIDKIKKIELFFLKTICFALCMLFLFQSINVIAWRVFEFFNVMTIFYLPALVMRFKQKYMVILFVCSYVLANLYVSFQFWGVF